MGLVLLAVDVAGPLRWRWLLVDAASGAALADHEVNLDSRAAETEAFENLHRFVRWRAEPDRRVASEAEIVGRIGAWLWSAVLGRNLGQAIVRRAPVTVRVQVPAGAEFLAFRPLELAHVDGVPLAGRGDVALVYELAGPDAATKAPVGGALRMLAVFSLPTETSVLALRRERYELSKLVRRVAARAGRRVELEVVQYGVTRAKLRDLARHGDGWDVLHLAGHGGIGEFLLEKPDGAADPVSTGELVELLRPARQRVKLAVVSACQSAAATTAETLRWLGLADPATALEAEADAEAERASGISVGVARALVGELGCAVVAMRYPVVDEFAVGFADALYDRLFRLAQPVDRAIAEAVPAAAGVQPSAARPAISIATPAIFGLPAAGLTLAPPAGDPEADPAKVRMPEFPDEPPRFVGRAAAMAAASAALAPESGRAGVLFHGMAGAGKTACALELAYRHERAFGGLAFWAAPTDRDQFGDALRRLAVALERQLPGFAMVDKIGNRESFEAFLPRLRALLRDSGLLLVLDNLETLLTAEGRWRDPRWEPLVAALTSHGGESRVILTSRVRPSGLPDGAVLVRSVHALSRDESVLLARELPNLGALLRDEPSPTREGRPTPDPVLALRVLTLVQGHPKLLELADAAAADRARLESALAAAESTVDGAALSTFLREGTTALDATQLFDALTAWTNDATATLPAPSRLLLQALCHIEESDRNSFVLGEVWPVLWGRLDQPGDPPPLEAVIEPLVDAALIEAQPADLNVQDAPVSYGIHPGVAEAIQATTPEPMAAVVDVELAAFWTTGAVGAIESEEAGKGAGQVVVRAGLAATPYLLRRHDWETAAYLLDHALFRDGSPGVAQTAIPALRRIARATGDYRHHGLLARTLIEADPDEAETLFRRIHEYAATHGDNNAAIAASPLAGLLVRQGRLHEALVLVDQWAGQVEQGGTGPWTELSIRAQRLHILQLLGEHEQVLSELPALRSRMAALSDRPAASDTATPWAVRERILEIARLSALALGQWQDALEFNNGIAASQRQRGASPREIAGVRLNSYGPLLRLGRLPDAEEVLSHCQRVFEASGDVGPLAKVVGARADLEARRGHHRESLALLRSALRLEYVDPEPAAVAAFHQNLAISLDRAAGDPMEQRAHRLAAALLYRLTGMRAELTNALRLLAAEVQGDGGRPGDPVLPATLPEITAVVDAGEGVRFGELVGRLCPDRAAAERNLQNLLAEAATMTGDVQAEIDQWLVNWERFIATVVDAVRTGDVPSDLADVLGHFDNREFALVAGRVRRILNGDRDRDQLLGGLDLFDAAVVRSILDRIAEGGS